RGSADESVLVCSSHYDHAFIGPYDSQPEKRTISVFILMTPRPPTSTLFPYTTLFRSTGWRPSISPSACSPTITPRPSAPSSTPRSEEHTSELQSPYDLVCRLLLEKKKARIRVSFSCLLRSSGVV